MLPMQVYGSSIDSTILEALVVQQGILSTHHSSTPATPHYPVSNKYAKRLSLHIPESSIYLPYTFKQGSTA